MAAAFSKLRLSEIPLDAGVAALLLVSLRYTSIVGGRYLCMSVARCMIAAMTGSHNKVQVLERFRHEVKEEKRSRPPPVEALCPLP